MFACIIRNRHSDNNPASHSGAPTRRCLNPWKGVLITGAAAVLAFPSLASASHRKLHRVIGADQRAQIVNISTTPTSSSMQGSSCSQPVTNPWLYAESCLAGSAVTTGTVVASNSPTPAAATGIVNGTLKTTPTQPSTNVQTSNNSRVGSCTPSQVANPYLRLAGSGC